MKQKITISGNNWNDIFKVPCVEAVYHIPIGGIFVVALRNNTSYEYAHIGDSLVQDENGKWQVEYKEGGCE